jgi:quercetin dioxygenase-like cupin family protein
MPEFHWNRVIALVLISVACAAIVITRVDAVRPQDRDALVHAVLPMDDSAWYDGPPGLPPGGKFAVISGDPAKPTIFIMRVELPPSYTVSPYRRLEDESIVVLAGALEVGTGSTFDQGQMRELPTGSYISLRANEPHYAMTKHGATVQIISTGPFAIDYVDAAKNF